MKSRILGWSNVSGTGEEVLICGQDVPSSEQARIFHEAKALQKFPKGIVRLCLEPVAERPATAIYLGEEIAKSVQASHDEQERSKKNAEASRAASAKRATDLAEARKQLSLIRNTLSGLASRKKAFASHLADSEANFRFMPEQRHKDAAEVAKSKLASVDDEIIKAQKEFDKATATIEKLESSKTK
jgi:hypothetical protein